MANFVIYDSTGYIWGAGYVADGQEPNQVTTQAPNYLVTSGTLYTPTSLYYVTGGVVTTRTLLNTIASWNVTSIPNNGVTTASLSGLPNPTTISFVTPAGVTYYAPYTETSGTASITSTFAGSFTVNASSFPYADFLQVITVT